MTTTAAPSADLDAKIAKVRALRLKTVANGCTADEADAAQAMADKLQAKYGLTDDQCAPVSTARSATTSSPGESFFAAWMRQERAENAKRVYRQNGTHIDEGYHPDCRCPECRAHRTAKAKKMKDAYSDSNHTHGTYYGEAGFYSDPSTSYGSTKGPRKNKSHDNCSHEKSSAARARCRREGGPA